MNRVEALFSKPHLQEQFDELGFVKTPLLNEIQANELYALFQQTRGLHETVNSLHHTTTDTQNVELIRQVDETIKRVFLPELEKVMRDFKPLASCFHIKEIGRGSATGTHQDPTFVDENNFVSANVWVALHDMNEQNGNLFFIPRSHKVSCLRVTPSSSNYYDSFYDLLLEAAIQVPMKKGEAVIFNNATIHGATDNVSHNLRLAATLLVCSKPADWLLFYKDENTPDNKIEKYALDFEKFIAMPKNGRPDKSALKEFVSYNFPQLTKAQFLQIIRRPSLSNGYFRQIKNAIKKIML